MQKLTKKLVVSVELAISSDAAARSASVRCHRVVPLTALCPDWKPRSLEMDIHDTYFSGDEARQGIIE